jgi:hypothetical protein
VTELADIIVAGVNAGALVVVALLTNRARQHSKAAREQVQNTHSTNLRDDLDGVHRVLVSVVDRLDRLERRRRRPLFTRNRED